MQKLEEKYGIPNFETCEKLVEYWKEETLFTVYKECNDLEISLTENFEQGFLILEPFKAPQIHELLAVLPNKIITKHDNKENCVFWLEITNNSVSYINYFTAIRFVSIKSNNMVECLAQIYLKLKQNKLL